MHWGVARTRAALATALVAAVAVALVSGGSSADPNTPPALPGLPPPFETAAALGGGGLSAGIDAYGDVVDLRAAGPAGPALIDDPYARQLAGTVPADTGIVPLVSIGGGATAAALAGRLGPPALPAGDERAGDHGAVRRRAW